MQVTRLTCGGFIFGLRMNHAMCDGCGIGQFMIALGQLVRGATVPSHPPVWDRHLLMARDPPFIKFPHPEYPVGPTDPPADHNMIVPIDNLGHKIERSFFFGPTEIGALRSHLPPRLSNCGSFELLAAALWQARTRAMGFRPDHSVNLLCVVNARSRYTPPLPLSYYGNVVALPTVTSTAGELTAADLGRVVEMVQAAVGSVTDEYMRSVTDHIVANRRPSVSISGSYHISDLTRHGYDRIDFGWGQPVFCGVAKIGTNPGVASFLCSFENARGEKGIVVPACLPEKVMEKFLKELDCMTHVVPN